MKNNKLYPIIAFIIVLSLFFTAATCNFCGLQIKTSPETSNTENVERKDEDERTSSVQPTDQIVEDENENIETAAEESDTQEIQDTEPEIAMEESRLDVVPEETGSLPMEGEWVLLQYIGVGDLGYNSDTGYDYMNGYISFDITGLEGINIDSATLTMLMDKENGNRSHLGNLRIGTLDYGTGRLNSTAGTISAGMLKQFPNTITDIKYSENELADVLQKSINSGLERFQLKVYWSNPHNNNDETEDSIIYLKHNIYLTIRYTE